MNELSRRRVLAALAAGTTAVAFPSLGRGATQPLSVGQIGNSVAFFPLFYARTAGYFSDAGLDVTLTPFSSGNLVGTAVTSNSIDLGCSVMTDVFALIKANRPVKLVGSLVNTYYIDIVASNAFLDANKLSRSSSLADKVAALRNKRIGITGPGSGTQALVDFVFKSAKLDSTRDVELVNMGVDQAAIIAALKAGRIDAVSFAWPLSQIAESVGVGKPLIVPSQDVPAMRGMVQGVMYVREDALARKQDAVVAFVHAIARAEAAIHHDPAHAKAQLKQYDNALSDAAIELLMTAYLPALPNDPTIPNAPYDRSLAFHEQTGFATPAGTAYADTVASAVIERALRA